MCLFPAGGSNHTALIRFHRARVVANCSHPPPIDPLRLPPPNKNGGVFGDKWGLGQAGKVIVDESLSVGSAGVADLFDKLGEAADAVWCGGGGRGHGRDGWHGRGQRRRGQPIRQLGGVGQIIAPRQQPEQS
jgi:hypothetical protein